MQADSSPIASELRPLIPEELWRRKADFSPVQHHDLQIENGQPVSMDEGVWLLRLPLPFALNHINVYLLDDGDGWSIVDCGIDTTESRLVWETVLSSSIFGGRPVRRVIVTHHHPDHVGLAGWLSQRYDAPVFMTEGELAVAGRYTDPQRDIVAERTPLWHEHGLPRALAMELLNHMPRYSVQVHALPQYVACIDAKQPLKIGGRFWKPMIGQGHSPEHLSLLSDDGALMIGGDQVLPKITPNIAVWPNGDPNPLLSYLRSLNSFSEIGAQTLLLPSHKVPLRGIASRIEEIRMHHEDRLRAVLSACTAPMTCYEMLPVLFGRPLRNEEIGFGLGEAIAHLNFLESQNMLTSVVEADGQRRFCLS